MSSQFLTIGPSPIEEDCASVGRPDYEEQSRRECHVFLRQLERQFPPPDGASLFIKSFPHDFGAYREVCVRYHDDDAQAFEYAYSLEKDIPLHWDDIARYELCWHEQYAPYALAVCAGKMKASDLPAIFKSGQCPDLPADQSLAQLFAAFPLPGYAKPAARLS
jgi:hypothetical protein